MNRLYVVGAAMSPFGRFTDMGLAAIAGNVVKQALAGAGISPSAVDAVFVANAVGATVLGQEMVAGQAALRGTGLAGVPVFNVENACASGQSAVHLAAAYVRAGLAETVLALGVERMTHVDKTRPMRALAGAVDVEELGPPEDKPPGHSFFMDLYAERARAALDRGLTVEDFARVVVKNQANGLLNPRAQFGRDLSIEDVLQAREIVAPLTLLMCSPISDGAACVVITNRRPTADAAPPVELLATAVKSGRDGSGLTSATVRAVAAAYEEAGVGPEDLSLVELHDATAPAEIDLYQDLQLCGPGEAAALLKSGGTRIDGTVPVNASGGLLAKGHPVGATGIAQIVELSEQLTGRSGPRQVAGARIGLAHNAGGWIGDDNAVASVAILGSVR